MVDILQDESPYVLATRFHVYCHSYMSRVQFVIVN